jgi:multisubunit Na+/H+ antiporter MnhG subunit
VAASGEPAFIARAILIGALLLLTTPVAAYELAKAAAREERDQTAPVAPEVWGIASSVEKRGQVSSR